MRLHALESVTTLPIRTVVLQVDEPLIRSLVGSTEQVVHEQMLPDNGRSEGGLEPSIGVEPYTPMVLPAHYHALKCARMAQDGRRHPYPLSPWEAEGANIRGT